MRFLIFILFVKLQRPLTRTDWDTDSFKCTCLTIIQNVAEIMSTYGNYIHLKIEKVNYTYYKLRNENPFFRLNAGIVWQLITNLLIAAGICGWFWRGNTITGCLCSKPWSAIICNPWGNTGTWIFLKNVHRLMCSSLLYRNKKEVNMSISVLLVPEAGRIVNPSDKTWSWQYHKS